MRFDEVVWQVVKKMEGDLKVRMVPHEVVHKWAARLQQLQPLLQRLVTVLPPLSRCCPFLPHLPPRFSILQKALVPFLVLACVHANAFLRAREGVGVGYKRGPPGDAWPGPASIGPDRSQRSCTKTFLQSVDHFEQLPNESSKTERRC